MSRFGYNDSFLSAKASQECLQAATEVLSSLQCRPSPNEEGTEIGGRLGKGWAIRLIGGLIAPEEWLPVRLSVGVRDSGDQRKVTIRVDENFGRGSLLGVEQKMRDHCDALGGEVSRLLRSRLD